MTAVSPISIVTAPSIHQTLNGRESEIIELVHDAYDVHHQGKSYLPHSVFLRFPDESRNRIIGLPAYLGGEKECAGFKWIASFPNNIERSLDRASALIVLNSMETGFPKAILESSIISAKRTAASAALAAKTLSQQPIESIGLVGCGLIGFEIVNFVIASQAELKQVFLFDSNLISAEQFRKKCICKWPEVQFQVTDSLEQLCMSTKIVALATTAPQPYIIDGNLFNDVELVLNISLRDISPDIILNSINVVDDIDHVCREKTSIHLAEQEVGHREFITAELAEVFTGKKEIDQGNKTIIFSPFGLGVLDIAVAEYVLGASTMQPEYAVKVDNFFPQPWRTI